MWKTRQACNFFSSCFFALQPIEHEALSVSEALTWGDAIICKSSGYLGTNKKPTQTTSARRKYSRKEKKRRAARQHSSFLCPTHNHTSRDSSTLIIIPNSFACDFAHWRPFFFSSCALEALTVIQTSVVWRKRSPIAPSNCRAKNPGATQAQQTKQHQPQRTQTKPIPRMHPGESWKVFFAVRCLRATKVAGGALQSAEWVKRRTS